MRKVDRVLAQLAIEISDLSQERDAWRDKVEELTQEVEALKKALKEVSKEGS